MSALHVVVHGVVQGVGFRFFVQRQARALGLAGWVRNLAAGSVEFVAEGPRPDLESLLDAVRRGPRLAVVDSVDAVWGEAAGFEGFEVRG